jgi:hypothetical protein
MKSFRLSLVALLLSTSISSAQIPVPLGPNGGSGGSGGGGAVSSVSGSCGVTVSPTTGATVASGTVTARNNTATTDTITSTDCGKVVTESNASAVAVSITTSGLSAGFQFTAKNEGAGTATYTPTTGTIDGTATLALTQNQSSDLYFDGTNYWTLAKAGSGASPGGTSGQLQTNNGSGGFGAVAAPSGTVVGTTDTQTLTNKSIAAPEVNSGTLAPAQMPALTGNCTTVAGAVATTCDAPHPGYITNNWYLASGPFSQLTTGSTFTASQIYCRYTFVPKTVTIGTLSANVTTQSSSGNVQLAVYSNANGLPSALLSSTGSIATTSASTVVTGALGANIQIGPGGSSGGRDIWFCSNTDNTTNIFVAQSTAGTAQGFFMGAGVVTGIYPGGGSTSIDNISCSGANCNGGSSTFGTWPSSLAGSTWTYNTTVSRFPAIGFKVVSSP